MSQPGTTRRPIARHVLQLVAGRRVHLEDPRVLAPNLEGDLGHVWTPRRLVRIALSNEPVARPGTAYHYSNTHYLLLGLVVQASSTAKMIGYPTADVDPRGHTAIRTVLLALTSLALAVLVGRAPASIARRRRRRTGGAMTA